MKQGRDPLTLHFVVTPQAKTPFSLQGNAVSASLSSCRAWAASVFLGLDAPRVLVETVVARFCASAPDDTSHGQGTDQALLRQTTHIGTACSGDTRGTSSVTFSLSPISVNMADGLRIAICGGGFAGCAAALAPGEIEQSGQGALVRDGRLCGGEVFHSCLPRAGPPQGVNSTTAWPT